MNDHQWPDSFEGSEPWPLWASCLLLPLIIVWTLPQTLAGLAIAAFRRLQGHKVHFYRFGPFIFSVLRCRAPASSGISLGVVIFSDRPEILKHEFCHLITGLWLSWLYLPVYGLEYVFLGHDGSWHERVTCRLEKIKWGWQLIGRQS